MIRDACKIEGTQALALGVQARPGPAKLDRPDRSAPARGMNRGARRRRAAVFHHRSAAGSCLAPRATVRLFKGLARSTQATAASGREFRGQYGLPSEGAGWTRGSTRRDGEAAA